MSQFTVGEDIIGVLIIVGLISVFFVVWENSYTSYQRKQLSEKESRLLLSLSDYLRNGAISKEQEPGVITQKILRNELSSYIENLGQEGIRIKVKIRVRSRGTVFTSGSDLEGATRSVSLPITYENQGGRTPANLVINMEV